MNKGNVDNTPTNIRIELTFNCKLSLTEHGNFYEKKKCYRKRKKPKNVFCKINWLSFLKPEFILKVVEIVKTMF